MQESSKKNVLRVISAQDSIEETEVSYVALSFLGSSSFLSFSIVIYTSSMH